MGIKQADEYFGDDSSDREIIDTEDVDVSKIGRRAVEEIVKQITNTKELDIRTPEGQKVIKQRLMSDVIRSWAASSNKVFLSTLVQEVAAEEFGIESDAVSLGKILPDEFGNTPGIFGVLKDMDEAGEKLIIPDNQKKAIRSILQAMREATQEYFKEKGITHVTLYRGMQIKPESLPSEVRAGKASRQVLQMRPLSSWATSPDMAQRFGGGDGYSAATGFEPRAGVIASTVVPVEDILAIPLTGFGCLDENEVVLIGKQREGVVHLSKLAYQTSRLSGRAKDSPDWPADQSKYDPSQEKLSEAILEYRDVLKEAKEILNSYVDDIIKEKSSASSYEERLSSGLVDRRTRVQLDRAEIEKRSRDFVVEFDSEEDKAGVAETLRKAFGGGYTVQIDAYSDIKEGISVGRNEHGMILRAGEGFDADGNPEPWLVDMFLDWMRLHGPSTFEKPKEGATQVALGGWRTKDGKVYLDVVDIYPETPEFIDRAVQLGLGEDQIAVTKLKKLWELLDAGKDLEGPDSPFIYSGGRGGRTISVKTLREFSKRRKELLERIKESGSPDVLQVGKTTRIELKNARNMKRIRAVDRDGVSKNEFLLFDSPDGLSVTAYSGEQLASIIGDEKNKKPTLSQIKRLLETRQPVAALRINRGIDENVPAISYIKDEQIDTPGLFEALSRMHMQFNTGQRDKEDLRLSSGARYPIPPGTNKYPTDSSGFGSMPGDPDGARIKMVPISLIRQYREFERDMPDQQLDYSDKTIRELTEELRAGGIIREPFDLSHSRATNWAYISEGNHRLAAAEKAGLTHVPVRVLTRAEDSNVDRIRENGRGGPLSLIHPRMWARNERDTYVPEMITPALFAELQDDDDRSMLKDWENEQTEQWRLSAGRKPSPNKKATRKRTPKKTTTRARPQQPARQIPTRDNPRPANFKTIPPDDERIKEYVDFFGDENNKGAYWDYAVAEKMALRGDWERLSKRAKESINEPLLKDPSNKRFGENVNMNAMLSRMIFRKQKFIEYTDEDGKNWNIAIVQDTFGRYVAIDVDQMREDYKKGGYEFYSWDQALQYYALDNEDRKKDKIGRSAILGWMNTESLEEPVLDSAGNPTNERRTRWVVGDLRVQAGHRYRGLGKQMYEFHNEIYPELETEFKNKKQEEQKIWANRFANSYNPPLSPDERAMEGVDEWYPAEDTVMERLKSGATIKDPIEKANFAADIISSPSLSRPIRRRERYAERLSSGAETPRTTQEKLDQGPKYLQFGRSQNGAPRVATIAELRKVYGKHLSENKKYFENKYQKYNLKFNFKRPPAKGDIVDMHIYYGQLQAMDDVLSVLDESEVGAMLLNTEFNISQEGFTIGGVSVGAAGTFRPDDEIVTSQGRFRTPPKVWLSWGMSRISVDGFLGQIRRGISFGKTLEQIMKDANIVEDSSAMSAIATLGYPDGPNVKEDFARRIAYGITIHEFGHMLDSFARKSLQAGPASLRQSTERPSRSSRIPITGDNGGEAMHSFVYSTLDTNFEQIPSITKYGSENIVERTAEAFAAWWLFSGTPYGTLKVRPIDVAGRRRQTEEDISVIAKMILKPLFDSLGNAIKSDSVESEESPIFKTDAEDIPPLVKLFAILPYIKFKKER